MAESKKSGGGKIKFHCPHCDTAVAIGYESAGKNATCPKCGKAVIVPFEQDPSVVLASPPTLPLAQAVEPQRRKTAVILGGLLVLLVLLGLAGALFAHRLGRAPHSAQPAAPKTKNDDAENVPLPDEKVDIAAHTKNTLSFRVGKEKLYDTMSKTQVLMCVEITADKSEINGEKLEATLRSICKTQAARTGFTHHKTPTHIFLYAFATREGAEWGGGTWLAMLTKRRDEPISVTINDHKLKRIMVPPEERFGLSEGMRREIYAEITIARYLARREGEKEYPSAEDSASFLVQEARIEQIFNENLKPLAKKHNLTIEQLNKIYSEGAIAQWPSPR